MAVHFRWRSQIGTRTSDNRDCAGIGIRGEEALCILLDGSSTGRDSGALARQIARGLVDGYVASDETVDAGRLREWLHEVHRRLSVQHPQASASYLLLHLKGPDGILALHAGDCLLGRRKAEGGIDWLCQPHTLANATADAPIPVIADLPTRHLLTRSFRAREFMAPQVLALSGERELVIATDGFWAELSPQDQVRFMAGADIATASFGDDRSFVQAWFADGPQDDLVQHAGTFDCHIRVREGSA
jgi:serine/threonine protein phosphatase PrpC